MIRISRTFIGDKLKGVVDVARAYLMSMSGVKNCSRSAHEELLLLNSTVFPVSGITIFYITFIYIDNSKNES